MDDQTNTPAHPFESLQSLLISSTDVQTFLNEVAVLAVEIVGANTSCGITTTYARNLLTVGSSDARPELLDESQYRFQGGPCLQSLQTGKVVQSDTATETRWPDYNRVATHQGLAASLSLPMKVSGRTLGALNIYSFSSREVLRPELRRELNRFVAQAAIALRLATRQAKDETLLTQLEEALESRTIIARPWASSWPNDSALRPTPSTSSARSPRTATSSSRHRQRSGHPDHRPATRRASPSTSASGSRHRDLPGGHMKARLRPCRYA